MEAERLVKAARILPLAAAVMFSLLRPGKPAGHKLIK